MMFEKIDPDDEESMERARQFLSPVSVDQSVRHAMQMCWMMLPKEKKNGDDLEKEFRRIVERAIKNMREDEQTFGGKSTD